MFSGHEESAFIWSVGGELFISYFSRDGRSIAQAEGRREHSPDDLIFNRLEIKRLSRGRTSRDH